MTDPPDLERLERDLARVAERIAPSSLETRRVERRLRRAARQPLLHLFWLAVLVVFGLAAGGWFALGMVVAWVPAQVAGLRERRRELAAATRAGGVLELEREGVERKLLAAGASSLVELCLAAALACLAVWGARPGLWILVGVLAGSAVVRGLVVVPRLERSLRDLGGKLAGGWMLMAITAALLLVAPLLVLAGVIGRAGRRLFGRSGGGDA